MNHDVIVLLIRGLLRFMDPAQCEELKRWLTLQDPGPDPASDKFANAQRRIMLDRIDKAVAEVEAHGGQA